MAIALMLLIAIIGVMVAAIGALIGMGVAVFLDLPVTVCASAGAAIAILGAILLGRQASRAGQRVDGHSPRL